MKIILIKNVDHLGQQDDIKEVNNGYARNFLIPKGLAVLATKEAVIRVGKIKEERAKKAEEELKITQKLAQKIDGQEIEIRAKAKDGKLFGSVGAQEISEALQKAGFKVKRSNVKLKTTLKEIGESEIELDLAHGLEAKIKVIIKPEE